MSRPAPVCDCRRVSNRLLEQAATRTSTQEGNLVFRADIGAAIENEGACMSKTRLPQPVRRPAAAA